MIENTLDKLRLTWSNLSERERRITIVMGGALLLFIFFMPLALMTLTNSNIEEENERLQEVLEKIVSKRTRLKQITNEKRLSEKRYKQTAPSLGGFLESLAKDQELTIREVIDQPEKSVGSFRRRNVRISIPNLALTPMIKLMSAIENSIYPIAVDYIQIEHYRTGDQYNIKLGVVSYEKIKKSSKTSDEKEKESGPEEEIF